MMDIANTKYQMYSKQTYSLIIFEISSESKDHLASFQRYQVFATYHLQLPPQFLIFSIFEIWDAITTCKWSDTNRPYFVCIFCHLHWTTNIVSIYYQSSSRMIHTDVVLQDDSHRSTKCFHHICVRWYVSDLVRLYWNVWLNLGIVT